MFPRGSILPIAGPSRNTGHSNTLTSKGGLRPLIRNNYEGDTKKNNERNQKAFCPVNRHVQNSEKGLSLKLPQLTVKLNLRIILLLEERFPLRGSTRETTVYRRLLHARTRSI